jgi:phage terminase small subunit
VDHAARPSYRLTLTKPDIAAAIEKAKAERAEGTGLTGDMVIDELRKIGFANMLDYMKSTPEGDPYLDFSALTRDQGAVLQEVTVEDFVDGRGSMTARFDAYCGVSTNLFCQIGCKAIPSGIHVERHRRFA